jgi:uncharacterized protein (TIGR01777 family)
MKILITGASGFVGSALTCKLLSLGHEVHILSRNKDHLPALFNTDKVTAFSWSNQQTKPPVEAITGIDGVINLMGENIAAKRWSPEQKEKLRTSRVDATNNLIDLIEENSTKPLKFFISSSAVGVYPVNRDETFNENSTTGRNFLAQLCHDWEKAASKITKTERLVIIRTGVVLEKHGGALKKMLPPFQLGLGGPIGDGNHYMSWIHLDDLVNIFVNAATSSQYQGIYNGVAPTPVNNFDFTKSLGKALHRPTLFPVPDQMLKLVFGEMSSVILDSQKIVSQRLNDVHFKFQYPEIDSALHAIFGKK